jgi:hypothetical protein
MDEAREEVARRLTSVMNQAPATDTDCAMRFGEARALTGLLFWLEGKLGEQDAAKPRRGRPPKVSADGN